MKEVILRQLAAAEASVQAAYALLDAWQLEEAAPPAEVPAPEPLGPCKHPAEKRKPIGTAGRPDAWLCLACDFIHEGDEHA